MFQACQTDPNLSIDWEHLQANNGLIARAFKEIAEKCKKAQLILSDSCTCTKSWEWDEENRRWYKYEDRKGNEFWNEIQPEGVYVPKWGKGLWEMKEEIKWRLENDPDLTDIVVIIAGNDIQYGKQQCQESAILRLDPIAF